MDTLSPADGTGRADQAAGTPSHSGTLPGILPRESTPIPGGGQEESPILGPPHPPTPSKFHDLNLLEHTQLRDHIAAVSLDLTDRYFRVKE